MPVVREYIGLITLAQIAAPLAPVGALAGAGAGNVDDGTHSYKITFVATSTETEGGAKSNVVTVASNLVDGKVSLTGIPVSSDSGVTARNIYRTEANADPDVDANYKLLATIANNTATTYLDDIADSSLTTVMPTTNDTVAEDFPLPLSDILEGVGMTTPGGLSFLQMAEVGAGNLVISSDPNIAAEADGYPVGDAANPLIMPTSGSMNDVIQAGCIYPYSTTPGKQAAIIARAKI